MITNDLFLVLKNFQRVREKQGENEKLTNLAAQFMNVAENITWRMLRNQWSQADLSS